MKDIVLNNGKEILDKFKKEEIKDQAVVVRLESDNMCDLEITDNNIKSNAKSIINLFDLNGEQPGKRLVKKN